MTHDRYQKQVRAIIVFGDIRGFSIWEQGVTRPDIEFKPLMNKFDLMVDEFEAKTGHFTKNLGDGYMQVLEIPASGHVCNEAVKNLLDTVAFATKIQKMIKTSVWPRPAGFRVRWTSGHVWKKDGNKRDYVGRHINLAHKLLNVAPETEFLAHQSFVELMSKKQSESVGAKFIKVDGERRAVDGILKVDMAALWALQRFRKK